MFKSLHTKRTNFLGVLATLHFEMPIQVTLITVDFGTVRANKDGVGVIGPRGLGNRLREQA